jgi:uncharacterized membrane protein YqjE
MKNNKWTDEEIRRDQDNRAQIGAFIGGLGLAMFAFLFIAFIIATLIVIFAGWDVLTWIIGIPVALFFGIGLIGIAIEFIENTINRIKEKKGR